MRGEKNKIYIEDYKQTFPEIIREIFPEFTEIEYEHFPTPSNVKSGDNIEVLFNIRDDKDNWDNEGISILFGVNQENKDELMSKCPEFLEFDGYYALIMDAKSTVNIYPKYVNIYLRIKYELITSEDYWSTIGYFQTKHDSFCQRDAGFNIQQLYNWANEWEIMAEDKEEICKQIQERINELRWNDVKNI